MALYAYGSGYVLDADDRSIVSGGVSVQAFYPADSTTPLPIYDINGTSIGDSLQSNQLGQYPDFQTTEPRIYLDGGAGRIMVLTEDYPELAVAALNAVDEAQASRVAAESAQSAAVAAQAAALAAQTAAQAIAAVGIRVIQYDTELSAWPTLDLTQTPASLVIWCSLTVEDAPTPPQLGFGHVWAKYTGPVV